MISCENWWSLRWPHCSGSCRDHTAWEVTRVTRCYRLRSLWVPFDLSWFQSKQRLFSSFYETYVVWKSAHTPARTSTPPLNGKKRLYSWSWQCSFLPEWWAFPCCSLLANFAVVSACPALSACFPKSQCSHWASEPETELWGYVVPPRRIFLHAACKRVPLWSVFFKCKCLNCSFT